MSNTTATELRRTLIDRVEYAVPHLKESQQVLDLTRAPSPDQHQRFNVRVNARDTGKYRARPGTPMRMAGVAAVRVAYRLGKAGKAQTRVLERATKDAEAIVEQLMTRTNRPLDWSRPMFRGTSDVLHPAGEWLYQDSLFTFEYDHLLPAAA